MVIQAIIFRKDKYNRRQADSWLRRHNYVRTKPIHSTLHYLRARLKEPNQRYEYRLIKFGDDIKAVVGFLPYQMY